MQLYQTFKAIRDSNLKARKENNYYKLLENGQALLDYAPDLIELMVNNEHEYRKREAELSNTKDDNGKFFSNSYCETQAKSTDNYREYIKAKATLDWLYDSVNLAKKLAVSNEQELHAHIK